MINLSDSFIDRSGLPRQLGWGYLGVLLFMMGCGIEIAWLSPYLIERGLSMNQTALLFSFYGIVIAISSWMAGVLTESLNPKRTMLLGLLLFLLGTVGFTGWGLKNLDFPVLLITYAIRGFGYPFFAYSFLVWITYISEKQKLGRAVGWFWFVFTGGLNVLATYYSVWAIKHLGNIQTLWSSIFWVLAGAFFALVMNKAPFPSSGKGEKASRWQELAAGLTILGKEPKVMLGGIVRIINTAAQFAFPVFLPVYMAGYDISTTEWLKIWGSIFTVNILFNLIFGFVGDRWGWRKTVIWFGGVGCAVGTLLFYYAPQFSGGSFWIIMLSGIIWGAALSGYVPLSALVPSLVEKEKGAAVAILNLGAGLSVFAGPAIVALCISWAGNEGVVWILALLYLISALLTWFIKLPAKNEEFTET